MRRLACVVYLMSAATMSPVLAADLPPAPPPQAPAIYVPPPPPFTWTGVYIGINGGYAWGQIDTSDNTTPGSAFNFKSNGGIVGGTLGFNYQWNWFVAGAEGDLDWSGQKFTQSGSTASLLGVGAATLNYKNDVLATFAARFGVAVDHWLFYGKAGGAWTKEEFDITGTDPTFGVLSGSNSFSRLGWMAGAGAEYAITNHLTVKAEYNFLDFGSENETLTTSSSFLGTATASITSKPTVNVIKVGVNWLFNGTP